MTNFCCSLIFQKKAEEAHKILEGLGPKVELVCDLMIHNNNSINNSCALV